MQTSTSGLLGKPPVDFTYWFVEDCILDALRLSNHCKRDVIKKNLTTLIPTTQLYRIEVANFDKRLCLENHLFISHIGSSRIVSSMPYNCQINCKRDVIKKNLTTLIPTTQSYRIEVANFDKREMQNKILEAMAMKVPVITTSYANASLGAVDREHVLIANNKKEFAQRIAELLDNNELRIKLMDNAYLYINEHFTKDVIAAKVLRLVGE